MRNKLAVIAIAILAVPLALYFVPYSYAAVSSSDYVVKSQIILVAESQTGDGLSCNTGDYAVSGGYHSNTFSDVPGGDTPIMYGSFPTVGGSDASGGQTPDGWAFEATNPSDVSGATFDIWVVCQTPITVAGIGVPEFGQLYVAIALGALVFYLMGRYMTKKNALTSVPSTTIQ
jgi:hypothetical protein